ncbi:MAG: DUF3999 family protein [Pseudoxanthomonas sp.]
MINLRKFAAPLLVWCSVIAAAPAGSDSDPASYRVQVPVVVAAGSGVQRLVIPAEALAGSQAADLTDIRIFDAANRAMPMARIAPAAGPGQRHELAPLPILGAADALKVTGVSLRLDGEGRTRVARIDGASPDGPAQPAVLGVLLDARAIAGSAGSLIIAAEVPAGQPVTFTVEASPDLKNWRPLAEDVVYRSATATDGNAQTSLPLDDAVLGGDYLRIAWHATSRLLSPVTVRKASLLMRPDAAAGVTIAASLPPLIDARIIEFSVPFAAAVETIRLASTGTDVIVPVRVLGRDHSEQPWAVMGEGTATRPGGNAQVPRAIALSAGRHREWRIEADPRSSGFTSPPQISLMFARHEIAFLADGSPPYTLVAGRAGANDVYLPLESLMTQATEGAVAIATTRATPVVLQLQPIGTAGAAKSKMLLWAILLAATALLGAMAWSLWKRGGVRN